MSWFPPIPAWDAMHVVVVHIPVALLLVSPLFVAMGIMPGPWRSGLRIAALLVLLLGTGGAYLAVETGEAAAQIAQRTEPMAAVLKRHAELAEWTRNVFTGIALAYAAFLACDRLMLRLRKSVLGVVTQLLLLVACLAGALLVANTGHLGGRLVHEFDIRAPI